MRPTKLVVVALLFVLAIASTGCNGVKTAKIDGDTDCRIYQDPSSYIGQQITLTAIYRADKLTYEYLEDARCGKKAIINVGNPPAVADASVAAFQDAVRSQCEAVCAVRASVVIEGTVDNSASGEIVFRPTSVKSYEFVRSSK
jgi:hypothetical protein